MTNVSFGFERVLVRRQQRAARGGIVSCRLHIVQVLAGFLVLQQAKFHLRHRVPTSDQVDLLPCLCQH